MEGYYREKIGFLGRILRGCNTERFIEFVKDRNKPTLHEVINRWIKSGSIICSDSWKSYGNLKEVLPKMKIVEHKTVNHFKNFVNPSDSASHTKYRRLLVCIQMKIEKDVESSEKKAKSKSILGNLYSKNSTNQIHSRNL